MSERFESKRIQEKNKSDSFKIRCFSKVQNGVVWTVTVFFIIIIYNNRPNLVPAKICISAGICRNCPKWPETARNLTRDGTGGGGIPVPDCILVQKISAIPAQTEQNQ